MTQPSTDPATAVYLFAVCDPAVPRHALSDVAGHRDGGPVRTLTAGSLTAVVQDVPAAEFTEEALRRRLADPADLELCARAHHHVVSHAAARTDALPLPLATLYLSEDSLHEALLTDAARFHSALGRIAGREEWGVKVYVTRRPAPSPTPATAPAASGRAYLERVRGRNRDREARAESTLRCADRVEESLRETAVAVRRLRTHGTETTGTDRPQALNAACLLPRGGQAALSRTVNRLCADGDVEIDVTGPWVPYSFVDAGGR